MRDDRLKASVLAARLIPNVDAAMAKELNLPEGHRSIGIITSDCDDVTYTALDDATKKVDIKVVYAKSFYGGAANANTKLAGSNRYNIRSKPSGSKKWVRSNSRFYRK